mgnify:CR=1 FL=1
MSDNEKQNSKDRALVTISEPTHALDILPEGMMTPAAIEARMKLQTEQRNAFLGWIRKSMTEGIHFMPAPRKGTLPYLKQEGAMFVKDFFGAEPDYFVVEEIHKGTYYKITVKCALECPSGKVYKGLGWANSEEYSFLAAVESRTEAILRKGEYPKNWKREDIYTSVWEGEISTVGQMARKRALVNAVRHLPFVAELFTEERVAESKPAGISTASEEGLSAKHRARLRKIHAQHKQLGVSSHDKIKERIADLMKLSPDFSLAAFVQDDKLYTEYQDIIDLQLSKES